MPEHGGDSTVRTVIVSGVVALVVSFVGALAENVIGSAARSARLDAVEKDLAEFKVHIVARMDRQKSRLDRQADAILGTLINDRGGDAPID